MRESISNFEKMFLYDTINHAVFEPCWDNVKIKKTWKKNKVIIKSNS